MSRSRRHTPVHGITSADSETLAKRWWNRVFRRRERLAVQRGDDVLPMNFRKETEVWSGRKEGKTRFDPTATTYDGSKMMRK